jgi:hypothetical protein
VAAAAGVPVLLDAGGVDTPLSPELLQHLTIISPNETELQRLTGLPTGSEEELLIAAAALQQRAAEQSKQQQQGVGLQVLLKLGIAGSMMVPAAADDDDEGQVVRQPAIRAPQVVDTTGKTPSLSPVELFTNVLCTKGCLIVWTHVLKKSSAFQRTTLAKYISWPYGHAMHSSLSYPDHDTCSSFARPFHTDLHT